MFETLTDSFSSVFGRLRRRGLLTERDVGTALREIRLALLAADVALEVVKPFIDGVRAQATSEKVLRSVTPGQQVAKIVHDHLVELLGGGDSDLALRGSKPVSVLLVGLQGTGKTTSAAKLGSYLQHQHRKKVLMASLDTRRPAAREQLRVLGEQANLATIPISAESVEAAVLARGALQAATTEGYDVVIFDSAGRMTVGESASTELVHLQALIHPAETLLVADAMGGQSAASTAAGFKSMFDITGVVLTRMDSDARGGAALSMRKITGQPIKFIGVGEKLEDLEVFHPERMARRILGMGDIASLVERVSASATRQELDRQPGLQDAGARFTVDDLLLQLRQLRQLGGVPELARLLPVQLRSSLHGGIDERSLERQEAIILSMTQSERSNVRLLNASRRRRIAKGSGTGVPEVNRLVKQFHEMQTMMKKMTGLRPHALEQMLGRVKKSGLVTKR